MSTGVTIIRASVPATVDEVRGLLRTLAQAGRGSAGPVRTWAFLGDLAVGEPGAAETVDENARVVEHDRIGRLAVRLAVDKTLCIGDSRSVRALYQGAVMEGSWGDEARIVQSGAEAAALVRTDGDWRPGVGDVVLLAVPATETAVVIESAVDQAAGTGGHGGRDARDEGMTS